MADAKAVTGSALREAYPLVQSSFSPEIARMLALLDETDVP